MKLITVATGAVALGALLTGATAADASVHPFTPVTVTGATAFLETFTSGDLGAWSSASDEKYAGVATVVKADGTEDDGLYVTEAARHYGYSAPLAATLRSLRRAHPPVRGCPPRRPRVRRRVPQVPHRG